MTIHIEGVRIPAVSESNQGNLIELVKFRHPTVQTDMGRFLEFLRAL